MRASSVIERRESATTRNQTAGSRLLPIGELSFAVMPLAWLIYAMTHIATYTVDPAELRVTTTGSLSGTSAHRIAHSSSIRSTTGR
jgi:hypothetical protein